MCVPCTSNPTVSVFLAVCIDKLISACEQLNLAKFQFNFGLQQEKLG